MKTLIVLLCAVVAAALANHLPNLPENERIKLRDIHLACQADAKTYVDEDKLRRLSDFVDDKQVGVHMLCMAVKANLMRHNGDLNLSNIKEKVSLVVRDQSKVDGLVRKCAQKAENPGKTASVLIVCFVSNDIQYYHKL